MKRSEINAFIREAIGFFDSMNFKLPAFGYFSLTDWRKVKDHCHEIFDLALGWDITDFGLGDFSNKGLMLFTIRNGKFKSQEYDKPYAEKIMIVDVGQVTPYHYHWNKMEDIINRGGGDLVFQLYQATDDDDMSDRPVQISIDGMKRELMAGEKLCLSPGESLTLPPRLYHTFYGEKSRVLVGEVSSVNDDASDNNFYGDVGRFPEIEEDVEPDYLLCSDYQKFLF
jgi:D-lyxose ketol-isomerase